MERQRVSSEPEQSALLRSLTRRRFLAYVALSAGAASLAACGGAASSALVSASPKSSSSTLVSASPAASKALAKTVRATQYVETGGYVLAKAKGWYEQATKASFEWTEVENGNTVLTLLASNSLDVGFGIGGRPVISGISNGVPFKVVGLLGNSPPVSVLARTGANLASASDLAGKRVGVGFGTNAQLLLYAWLNSQGVAPSTLDLKDLDVNPLVAAWSRGDIDVAVSFEPATSSIAADGGAPIAAYSTDVKTAGIGLYDQIIAADSFVNEYPDTVVGILQAIAHAVDFWNSNQADTAAALAAAVGLSVKDTVTQMATYDLLTLDEALAPEFLGTPGNVGGYAQGLKNLADSMVEMKLIPTAASAEEFASRIDTTALARAAAKPFDFS